MRRITRTHSRKRSAARAQVEQSLLRTHRGIAKKRAAARWWKSAEPLSPPAMVYLQTKSPASNTSPISDCKKWKTASEYGGMSMHPITEFSGAFGRCSQDCAASASHLGFESTQPGSIHDYSF